MEERIDEIANGEVLPKIVECMGSVDISLFVPALRCIGNILSASDPDIIERCLWVGVLDKLVNLLYQSNSNLIKEALWALSNITAGPVNHIERFVTSDCFERVLFMTENKNIELRKESLFVLCNALTGADSKLLAQIYNMTDAKILHTLIQGTNFIDNKLTMFILDSIEELLKLDSFLHIENTERSIKLIFERLKGLDALDELAKHPNMDIYNKT